MLRKMKYRKRFDDYAPKNKKTYRQHIKLIDGRTLK